MPAAVRAETFVAAGIRKPSQNAAALGVWNLPATTSRVRPH